MSAVIASPHLAKVRSQYEDYPYPPRNPADERNRLVEPYGCPLEKVVSHCFEGKRDLGKGFRTLDAGGGTGDNAIFLAEQLKETGGEVVYIDFSGKSKAIAEERAKVRGLTNITFIHDSLLNLPNLDIEPFDYICCVGVLHHLADPDAGLKALASVLKPDGAMNLMVYGTYGRLSVYPLQQAIRMAAPPDMDAEDRLRIAENLLKGLPAKNWFHHSTWFQKELKRFGKVGLYDLLVHTQDRSYTVPEVYDWLEASGLKLLTFLNEMGHAAPALNPSYVIQDPEILERVSALPQREQQAFVELIAGNISKHTFYAAPTPRKAPTPVMEYIDYVPFITDASFGPQTYASLADYTAKYPGGLYGLRHDLLGIASRNHASAHIALIYKHMDGKRTLRQIFDRVRADIPVQNKPDDRMLMAEFKDVFDAMNAYEWMHLHHPSTQRVSYEIIRNRFPTSAGKAALPEDQAQ